MKVIAFVNQKGGVGKTTTAVSVGHGLSLAGFKVLIVDLDSQGHVSVSLGIDKAPAVYDWLVDEKKAEDVVIEARPGLSVMRGDKSTDRVKRWAIGQDYREAILSDAFEEIEADFDFCLIDLSPSVDVLQTVSLASADVVVIVTRLDYLSMDGVVDVVETITAVEKRSKKSIKTLILPTMFERVTKETAVNFGELLETFGDRVLDSIPADTQARQAVSFGQTVFEYCPDRPVAIAYKKLVDKIVEGVI
jgi:chromosome partitioning protein